MCATPHRSRSLTRAASRPIAVLLVLATLLAACGESGLPFVPSKEPTAQPPRELTVITVEQGSAEPIAGVTLSVGEATAVTGPQGTALVTAPQGAEVAATAIGYDPASGTVPDDGDLTLTLRSNVVSGTITDQGGDPVAGARVFVDGQTTWVRSDQRGAYALPGVPAEGTLIVKLAGYRLAEFPLDGGSTRDVALEPFEARALYAPGAVFEGAGRLDQMLRLIERTEANAMVIDVKETGGYLYYETNLPEAKESGADRRPIFELEQLLPRLKERGIYTIARMVVMKDNTVGLSRPELAVRNAPPAGRGRTSAAASGWIPSTRAWPSTSPPSPATWRTRASTRCSSTTSASLATATTRWPTPTCQTRSRSGCPPSAACSGW